MASGMELEIWNVTNVALLVVTMTCQPRWNMAFMLRRVVFTARCFASAVSGGCVVYLRRSFLVSLVTWNVVLREHGLSYLLTIKHFMNIMASLGVCPQVAICLFVVAMLCLLQLDSVTSKNTEPNEATEEDDFNRIYGMPGIQFESRFEVGAGSTQCFYQKLRQDAQLHVTFEVKTVRLLVKFTTDINLLSIVLFPRSRYLYHSLTYLIQVQDVDRGNTGTG